MTFSKSSSDSEVSYPAAIHIDQVVGMAMGYRIAIVLQLEPVENAITADRMNTRVGIKYGLTAPVRIADR